MLPQKKSLTYIFKDPIIWITVLCAVGFWFSLSLFFPVTGNLGWPLLAPMAFLIPVVIYPVLEEIVFRGALLEFLHEKISGILFFNLTKANIMTSILFTSLHFFYHPPLWAAAVFIPSLVFGFLMERYQKLIVPIAVHVFFNAGYYWLFGN